MSQNGGDASKASSPGRPRHQINRSLSEMSSPIRLRRHQSLRAVATATATATAAGGRESDRDLRTHAPQSAIPPVQGKRSFEWSRSEAVTPNLTPSASRRTSVLYASADEAMPPSKALKDNLLAVTRLAREKQKAVARESGLQQSIADLDSFTSSTTKQLDDTYDSVLEKLNALQTTIASLKELAEHSRQLNSTFSTDAEELVTDVSAQLDAFGQFEDQQERIESLQSRIHAGQDLIRSLSKRVDLVSERIESWGQADRDWQEKTRKRLKVVWVVTLVVVFLVLSLFIGSQYAPVGLEETATHIASEGRDTLHDSAGAKAEVLRSLGAGPERDHKPLNITGKGHSGISSTTTDRLRVFDEL